MHSASQGRLAVVKWLLEHKADMEVKDHVWLLLQNEKIRFYLLISVRIIVGSERFTPCRRLVPQGCRQ